MDNQVRVASGLNIIAGLWLILSPFILGFYFNSGAFWNSLIVGAMVLVLAAVREWGADTDTNWASWVNLVLGIWLVVSPFIIGYSFITSALWNSVIVGILVAVFAGWSGSVAPEPTRRHRHV